MVNFKFLIWATGNISWGHSLRLGIDMDEVSFLSDLDIVADQFFQCRVGEGEDDEEISFGSAEC